MNKRMKKKKAKKEKEELELVIPEPDTESVPPSPITGQTADRSKQLATISRNVKTSPK